ncbi:TolC family protein [Salipiger sp. IMCC34102]|uniref:TolC family protein n=1 Tax=Salipiger sp. IMCC34102 TaxID=2510647 RepID=UPI0013EA0912|nr:TolC family protein [Salipiger sp. IMCC34102]
MCLALALSACAGGEEVSRSDANPADIALQSSPALDPGLPGEQTSSLIADLRARRSVLPQGPYTQLATDVLASRTLPAEQELRAARFRAQSASKNWLPSAGPQVNLTSVGSLVTTLFLEQTVLDNGRKKAERAYANAEVEQASVTLVQAANDRVAEALGLTLTAQAAEARASINDAALPKLDRYAYIMDERVRGGISSPVDARIVRDKLAEMTSQRDLDLEGAAAARAELATMTGGQAVALPDLADLPADPAVEPLPILQARAKAALADAEADAGKAGFFPGLSAVASLGSESDAGLTAQMNQNIGFGTRDAMRAIEAEATAARAAVAQTQEDTARRIAALEVERASKLRQLEQARSLAANATETFNTYVTAHREGQRTVREVVTLLEAQVDAARRAAGLRFDVIRTEIDLAALRGTLVDGETL